MRRALMLVALTTWVAIAVAQQRRSVDKAPPSVNPGAGPRQQQAQPMSPPGTSQPLQGANAVPPSGVQQWQSVEKSPHNLVPIGGGGQGGQGVCQYCHTAHRAAPVKGLKGLWNHQLSGAQYRFYESSTYKQSAPSLPQDAPSRLCLSCHDGTVALGAAYASSPLLRSGKSLTSAGNLGTDLGRDHPFAFDKWTRDDNLRDELFSSTPRATGNLKVKLWKDRIECTTCHEPHIPNIDHKRSTKFLVVGNANSALCLACHNVNKPSPNPLAGWPTSAHAVSTSTEGAAVAGYSLVGEGACMNCHTPHGSGAEQLLRGGEEKACFACHANSSSKSRWAQAWVGYDDPTKFMHPVQSTGHQLGENLNAPSTPRHSACWDCHDPHAAKQSAPGSPLQSSLLQATGVDKDGNAISPAKYTYEVCFKCHADSGNKPQTMAGYMKYGYAPTRQVDSHNVRLDLNSAVARHNVISPRSTAGSPALRTAILKLDGSDGRSLVSGLIYCGDCHNSNNAQMSGGTGSNGPHISSFEHLLERRYDMNRPAAAPNLAVMSLVVPQDGGDRFNGPFAMCNKCHDVAKLLSTGDTVFRHHASHVVDGGISCSVCHAPHGVQGNDAAHNAHSLNLDISIVAPDPQTRKLEINTITRTCYVWCHFSNDKTGARVHSGTRY